MARVIAIDLRAELDEQSRPCILFQFLSLDPLIPDGVDTAEQRIPIDPAESLQVFSARVRDAARAQIPRLNALHGINLTVGNGDCIVPTYTKV